MANNSVLDSLSDEELQAIANGNMDSLSNDTLYKLAGGSEKSVAPISNITSENKFHISGLPGMAINSGMQGTQNLPSPSQSNNPMAMVEKLQQILKGQNVSPIDRSVSGAVGGIPSLISGAKNIENTLPVVMGAFGSVGGTQVGHPNLGFGIGTGTGELLKQSIQKLKGNRTDISPEDVLIVGSVAAAGSKILDTALKSAGLTMKLIPEETRAAFFDKALQAVNVGYQQLGRNFRTAVNQLIENNPTKRVDLSGVMEQVSKQFHGIDETLIPQLKTAVGRSSALTKAVENPSEAANLTLHEAQELKNAITSTTNTIIKKAVKGKTTPNERVLFEILDSIDEKITEAFPKMSDVRRAYSEGKKAFEMARPLVEPGRTVETSIFSQPKGLMGVGGTPFMGSTQGKLAAKKIMGMTEPGAKMFKAAKLAHDINRVADFIGRVGEFTVGGTAIGVANKLLNREKD